MDVLIEILKYIGIMLAVPVGFVVFSLLVALIVEGVHAVGRAADRIIRRRRGRRRPAQRSTSAPRPEPADDPSWSCALLVDVDEHAARLSPRVQLRGSDLPEGARLRVELVDESETVRYRTTKQLRSNALRSDLALRSFDPPVGASLDDALGWRWDIMLEQSGNERARWQERLRPVEGLNAEAEIDDGCSPPERDTQARLRSREELEHQLMLAIFGPDAVRSDERARTV